MDIVLNEEEVRVLGSLIEKQVTTPEYYPLTMKALVAACNQRSNRNPVVSYDEQIAERAMNGLRDKKLGWVIKKSDSRVLKYGHIFSEVFHLSPPQTAAMCVLMLRGTLTPGEIRSTAGRLYDFKDLAEVDDTLNSLIQNEQGPMIVMIARQPGQKEARYAHLLAGDVDPSDIQISVPYPLQSGYPSPAAAANLTGIEDEIAALRREIQELKDEFYEFKKQFE
jgi:uncharacterized protein YceH (UPF0502 family)